MKSVSEEPASSGSYTSIDSVASTTSSSGVEGNSQGKASPPQPHTQAGWERFDGNDDETDHRPPIPPPRRSQLEQLYSDPPPAQFHSSSSDGMLTKHAAVEHRARKSKNPFERGDSIATDQLDFSSSIARTLFETAKKQNELDPSSADAMTTTSMDLFRIAGSSPECEDSPTVVHPTTSYPSSSNTTRNVFTTVSRSSGSSPSHIEEAETSLTVTTGSFSSLDFGSRNADSSGRMRRGSLDRKEWSRPRQDGGGGGGGGGSSLQPIPSEAPLQVHSDTSPMPSPSSAHRKKLPPPIKPRPYTGPGKTQYKTDNAFSKSASSSSLSSAAPVEQSHDDPFGGLLGAGGMVGYVASSDGSTTHTTNGLSREPSPLV